ncbi:MAG TPA: Hsp20/alpha crystallin family protein [Thermoanaerobaculia bacterium]|nr:Hsp20/alpha crystallin family protein [Thermoanaerobaculia bacterium]
MRRAGLFGPLMEITRLQSELNRLFSGILENQRAALATAAAWDPNADVLEDADEVRIIVEVPGLSAEDLSVAAQGNRVRIRGVKRAEPQEGEGAKFLCMERFFGDFEKIVPIPYPVNLKQASATLRDGLLTVALPRVATERRRFVEIQIRISEGNS